jgi:predicted nucleic acid-binding protein
MPDTIVIDTNVVKDIGRGNRLVAETLKGYLASGAKVYIAKASYNELIGGAPNRQWAGQYREILADLNIEVAPAGAMAERINFMADNQQRVPEPNKPGQIKEYGSKKNPDRPGDAFVAAQTKALGAKLWTQDETFYKRAKEMGLDPAPFLKYPLSQESPDAGRRLLGLSPKTIDVAGNVVPQPQTGRPPGQPGAYKPNPGGGSQGKGGGSGGGGGTTIATEGVADNTVPGFVGPSPRGEAQIAGIQLAFEGVNFALNLINDHIQKGKVEAALAANRSQIASTRAGNETQGVLLLFYYRQYEAPEESIIKPGAVFDYLIWGKGVTPDEARRDALATPTISQGTGRNERRFSQEVWLPPLKKTALTVARCPFPPIAVGRFFLGDSNKAKFQRVTFDVFEGFDDIIERSIDLAPEDNVNFAVLNPPAQVYWYNLNGRQSRSVDLLEAKTANGNTIKVVDLDPWVPLGHARAAMVFPMDAACEDFFKLTSPTDNYQTLAAAHINFSMIRWIRPQNIHLLSFL